MSGDDDPKVTLLLRLWADGRESALDDLLRATYGQLRRSARALMRHERSGHTLQATDLVHEAFVRLSRGRALDGASRDAFFGLMAVHMRRHLIDHARMRGAARRGGSARRVDLDDPAAGVDPAQPAADETGEQYLARLDRAMDGLAAAHPRTARVIQERFFADRTIDETAQVLGLSPGTVKREFAFGRAWLAQAMGLDASA